jgi:hypothetical protein
MHRIRVAPLAENRHPAIGSGERLPYKIEREPVKKHAKHPEKFP